MLETYLFRIAVAGIVGFVVGVSSNKIYTARTFAIVCIGAALVTISSTEFYKIVSYPWYSDPGRICAQVVSALGFIGTGLIWISEDQKIKGISRAASLWFTAILGMLIGVGLQSTSVFAVFIFVIIFWLSRVYGKKLKTGGTK